MNIEEKKEWLKERKDRINPDHYKHGEMQTIEMMMTLFGPKKVKTFCEVDALKYLDWYLRLANALGDADTVFLGMNFLKEFLKEEEEKNGRNSD